MEKKSPKIYLTDCNLLIVQHLLQAHCQIFSIMFLKEVIKLNVNTDTKMKNVKLAELNCFLEFTKFQDDSIEYKYSCCNKIINKSLMKS